MGGADLRGRKLAVLGGDARELVLIPELIRQGALVNVAGFPELEDLKGARIFETVEEAVSDVEAVIIPMPGTDDEGNIRAVYASKKIKLTEDVLAGLVPGTPIFIGVAKPFIRSWSEKYGLKLYEIAEMDHVAIFNSIPTAEGAIQIAMQETPITIHGSKCAILGFGRIGITLAQKLHALGAEVTIAARKKRDLARGIASGYNAVNFNEIDKVLSEANIVFNTVPAMVLDSKRLKKISPGTLILDLASGPGGTDFQGAEKLGLKAILAPGLPGKVAPVTAGKILAQVLPELIVQSLATSLV